MSASRDYDIHLDDKYGALTLIDIPAEIAAHEPWFNQTLTTVGESVVRPAILMVEPRDVVPTGDASD
ncbi:MAG TPA: hypothetical protein VF529_04100 [Solirubrobacteraceae bacterium]|jgi:hypothetical protein